MLGRKLQAGVVALTLALTGAAGAQETETWFDGGVTFPVLLTNLEARSGLLSVPPLRLFFDDHDQRDLAYVDGAVLVAGVRVPAGEGGAYAEAALSARLAVTGTLVPQDDGSYLRLAWPTEVGRVVVTGYPLGSDALRIGYARELSLSTAELAGPTTLLGSRLAPGLRAGLVGDWGYAYGAVSAAQGDVTSFEGGERQTTPATLWTGFGGVGLGAGEHLRLEAVGGWLYRGTFPRQALAGEPVNGWASSARVTWAVGLPWENPVEFRPLVDDPFTRDGLTVGPVAGIEGWSVSASGVLGSHELEDPDAFGETESQLAWGADLQAQMHLAGWRVDVLYRARPVELLLFQVPSLVPFQALTDDMAVSLEHGGAVQVARRLGGALGLTPRASVGLLRPATVTTDRLPAGINPPSTLASTVTLVVRDAGDFVILPADDAEIRLRIDGRLGLDLHLTEYAALALEGVVSWDPNGGGAVRDETGMMQPVRDETLGFGGNLLLRARF